MKTNFWLTFFILYATAKKMNQFDQFWQEHIPRDKQVQFLDNFQIEYFMHDFLFQ